MPVNSKQLFTPTHLTGKENKPPIHPSTVYVLIKM